MGHWSNSPTLHRKASLTKTVPVLIWLMPRPWLCTFLFCRSTWHVDGLTTITGHRCPPAAQFEGFWQKQLEGGKIILAYSYKRFSPLWPGRQSSSDHSRSVAEAVYITADQDAESWNSLLEASSKRWVLFISARYLVCFNFYCLFILSWWMLYKHGFPVDLYMVKT